jgi:hypothetical protein
MKSRSATRMLSQHGPEGLGRFRPKPKLETFSECDEEISLENTPYRPTSLFIKKQLSR